MSYHIQAAGNGLSGPGFDPHDALRPPNSMYKAAGGGIGGLKGGGIPGIAQFSGYNPYQTTMQPGTGMPGAYPGYPPNSAQYQQQMQYAHMQQMQQMQYMQKMRQMEMMRQQQLAQQQKQGASPPQQQQQQLQQQMLQHNQQEMLHKQYTQHQAHKQKLNPKQEQEFLEGIFGKEKQQASEARGRPQVREGAAALEKQEEVEGDADKDENDKLDEVRPGATSDEFAANEEERKNDEIAAMRAKLALLEQNKEEGKGKDQEKEKEKARRASIRAKAEKKAAMFFKENRAPQFDVSKGNASSSDSASFSSPTSDHKHKHAKERKKGIFGKLTDGFLDALGVDHAHNDDGEKAEAASTDTEDENEREREIEHEKRLRLREEEKRRREEKEEEDDPLVSMYHVSAVVDQRAQSALLRIHYESEEMLKGAITVLSATDKSLVFAEFALNAEGFNVTPVGRKLALVQVENKQANQQALLVFCQNEDEAQELASVLLPAAYTSTDKASKKEEKGSGDGSPRRARGGTLQGRRGEQNAPPARPGAAGAPSNRGPRAHRNAVRFSAPGREKPAEKGLAVRKPQRKPLYPYESRVEKASDSESEEELSPEEKKRRLKEKFRQKDAEVVAKRNALREKENAKKEEEERKKAAQQSKFKKQRDAIVRRARLKHLQEQQELTEEWGQAEEAFGGFGSPRQKGSRANISSASGRSSKYGSETPSTNSMSTFGSAKPVGRNYSPLRGECSVSELSVATDYNYGRSMNPLVPKDSPNTRQRMEIRRHGRDARKQEVKFMKDIEIIRNATNRRRLAASQKMEVEAARVREKEERMQRLIEKEDAVERELRRRNHNKMMFHKKKRGKELEEEHLQHQFSNANFGSSKSLLSSRWSSRRLLNNKSGIGSRVMSTGLSRRSLSPVAGEDGFDSTEDEASPPGKRRGRGDRTQRKGRLDTGTGGSLTQKTSAAPTISPAERARRIAERDRNRRLDRSSKKGRKEMMKQGMFGVLTYSALDIQRMWRGFCSRKRVKYIRYQVAVVTIQYWVRDIFYNRTLVATQKLVMQKQISRDIIGYWMIRRHVVPRRCEIRRQKKEHHEQKKREHEKRVAHESKKRAETEKAVAEARKKREEEERKREAAAAGEEGDGGLPGQDKSEACTIM